MNRDRAKGRAKEFEGRVLRRVGKLTGSKKTQLKGALRQAQGTLQHAMGEAKDSSKTVARRVRTHTRSARNGKTVTVKTTRTTTVRT